MIENYTFGSFVVDGKRYENDIKIIKGKIIFWKDHGLSLNDVQDVVAAKPEIIIIGTGEVGVVDVSQDIQDHIESKEIKLIIMRTGDACKEYNRLEKQGKNIAAILHNTC